VTGHPGTTNRLETVAKLQHRRDVTLPYLLARLRSAEAALLQFSERDPAYRKMAATDLHDAANRRKVYAGQYQALLNQTVFDEKRREESTLRTNDTDILPGSQGRLEKAWKDVTNAQAKLATFEPAYMLFERGEAFFSELFTIARHLVRLSAELPTQSSTRLREYRDSNLESLKFELFSPAPIHRELEQAKLVQSLTFLVERLGGSHPLVVKILDGKTPERRAGELLAGTRLADVAERRKLYDGGAKSIAASDDTMIRLARLVDPDARALRTRYENEVEEVERQAYAEIARVRFKAFGRNVAPDATFTLRLAFGVVQGYMEDGKPVPFHTTFGGAFDRAERMQHREPFALPRRWRDGKAKLDLSTPFNFVSTADTIGGNSGSPVLNRAGELVGVNFDRNRHGLVRNFLYTDEQARHIAVHCRAVLEALRKLYDCEPLVRELKGGT
jgi:hypothetical protein